jgi:hypothetical protein
VIGAQKIGHSFDEFAQTHKSPAPANRCMPSARAKATSYAPVASTLFEPISMFYTRRTTHTMSATRSIVPRMPPPMYIRISVSSFKPLLEHERRCLSGRYRTQPESPDPQRTVGLQGRIAGFSGSVTRGGLCRRILGKEPVVLLFDHPITLTSALLQPVAVEHRDVAARVSDQPGVL